MPAQNRCAILLLAFPALLAPALSGCGGTPPNQPEAVPTAEVTVALVVRADISRTFALTASVVAPPNRDIRISSLLPGRVTQVRVAEGEHVKAGEVLAKIEDRSYVDQLHQAEAGVAQAEASLQNAKLSLARNQSLVDRGIAARKDLDDARMQSSVAEASVQQAQGALSLARLQLQRATITSPLDGVVVKRFVGVGEQVDGTAAQPLVEVASLTEVELAVNLPAADLNFVRVGEDIPFTTPAVPGKTFAGRVVAISPAVDPATNAGLIRIRIANRSGDLRLGTFLNTRLPLETHASALLVPPQAIYRDQQEQAHVYRVTGSDAVAVPVRIGIETPEHVELLSGVQEGDVVILSGGYGLADKAKVQVKGPSAP